MSKPCSGPGMRSPSEVRRNRVKLVNWAYVYCTGTCTLYCNAPDWLHGFTSSWPATRVFTPGVANCQKVDAIIRPDSCMADQLSRLIAGKQAVA